MGILNLKFEIFNEAGKCDLAPAVSELLFLLRAQNFSIPLVFLILDFINGGLID